MKIGRSIQLKIDSKQSLEQIDKNLELETIAMKQQTEERKKIWTNHCENRNETEWSTAHNRYNHYADDK